MGVEDDEKASREPSGMHEKTKSPVMLVKTRKQQKGDEVEINKHNNDQ